MATKGKSCIRTSAKEENYKMDRDILNGAFHGAKLKLDRANKHINEAQIVFRRYVESDFNQIVQKTNPEARQQTIHIKTEKTSAEIALAIGDAFHCMNVAFDYVMTGMMRAVGASSARVTMPAHDSRELLEKSFRPPEGATADKRPPNARIAEQFPWLCAVLLDDVQTYRGGHLQVWEIRKADNIDKHNLIVPTITLTQRSGISFTDTNKNTFSGVTIVTDAGESAGLFHGGGVFAELKNEGQASAEVTFRETIEVFPGEPVFPTLAQCQQFASEAIRIFEMNCAKHIGGRD